MNSTDARITSDIISPFEIMSQTFESQSSTDNNDDLARAMDERDNNNDLARAMDERDMDRLQNTLAEISPGEVLSVNVEGEVMNGHVRLGDDLSAYSDNAESYDLLSTSSSSSEFSSSGYV